MGVAGKERGETSDEITDSAGGTIASTPIAALDDGSIGGLGPATRTAAGEPILQPPTDRSRSGSVTGLVSRRSGDDGALRALRGLGHVSLLMRLSSR
jgi:hypothetical protein